MSAEIEHSPVSAGQSAVVSLSGGIGSWGAATRALQRNDHVDLLFADTLIEDEDLYRFLDDIEAQLGHEIIRISDGRDPWDVFFDERFLGNTRIDPCSKILKRQLLRSWIDEHYPDGTEVVFGIDWTEDHRVPAIRRNYEPHVAVFPLIEDTVDRCSVLAELELEGITRPRLYDMGFPHNNCGGFCVKAGQAQFARLLHFFPERYARHEAREQELRNHLGKDVAILRDRRGGTTKPLTMREFRLMVERGEKYDKTEWGGCGCALDDTPSQLMLDIVETPVEVKVA